MPNKRRYAVSHVPTTNSAISPHLPQPPPASYHIPMRTPLLIISVLLTLPLQAQIQSIAGTGQKGFSPDNTPAAQAQLNNPFGLTKGPDQALYFCDTDNHIIRKITPQGLISTIAGTPTKKGYAGDNGQATAALLNEPYELRFDKTGDLYFVERVNHVVRHINMKTGTIDTLAGTGKPGFKGDNGPAKDAQFNQPHSLQFDPAGDLYICDILNHRIRKIDMKTSTITTYAGANAKEKPQGPGTSLPGSSPASQLDNAPIKDTPLQGPRAIDFDPQGNCYLALREGNAIYKVDAKTQTLHHLAGTGKKSNTAPPGNNGPAQSATLSGPKAIALARNGNVYIADTESHTIRMINPTTNIITTVAGTGEKGDGPFTTPLECKLTRPHGLYIDQDGTIYIGDSESHRILMLRQKD
ncbi:MAG: vgb 3 [Phycisphaerales bacterium]|nr:vgb 3 [Phycisphaerales bacterium]